jgi:SAM-dependent methyltransferase
MAALRTKLAATRSTLGRIARRLGASARYGVSAPSMPVFCPCCRTRQVAYEALWYTPNGVCPSCRSFHRHRLLMLYLERETDVLAGGHAMRVLHCAPEACIAAHLRRRPSLSYVSVDRCAEGYDYSGAALSARGNVTALPFRDGAFDLILCNHVFEHVDDDRAAMHEVLRVLDRSGWAVLMVPLSRRPETYEDPSVRDPNQRAKLFGQFDHVRLYGLDYGERLEASGFRVERIDYAGRFDAEETRRFGLLQGVDDTIVIGRRA